MFIKTRLSNKKAFKKVIEEALEDEKLKERAKCAQELLKARPFSAQELLTRHVDLALLFGHNLHHLTPDSRNYNIVQYYNLDVYLCIMVSFVSFITVCTVICWKYFLGKGKGETARKECKQE